MKNIIKAILFVLISTVSFACDPQDNDDHKLGSAPTSDQLDFVVSPSATNPNILEFKNTSSRTGVSTWDFGNGLTKKAEEASSEYPFKGEYDIVMTLYTTGGATSITKKVTIVENDFSLLQTEKYRFLAGEFGTVNGKTWVMDKKVAGHIGVGSSTDEKPNWWSAAADEKAITGLYDHEFTFWASEDGLKFDWKSTKGKVYTNEAGRKDLADKGFTNSTAFAPPVNDFDVEYTLPTNNSYRMIEAINTLILDKDAYFGHYIGNSTFTIVKLTADELYVKAESKLESGNMWWYRLVPKK